MINKNTLTNKITGLLKLILILLLSIVIISPKLQAYTAGYNIDKRHGLTKEYKPSSASGNKLWVLYDSGSGFPYDDAQIGAGARGYDTNQAKIKYKNALASSSTKFKYKSSPITKNDIEAKAFVEPGGYDYMAEGSYAKAYGSKIDYISLFVK